MTKNDTLGPKNDQNDPKMDPPIFNLSRVKLHIESHCFPYRAKKVNLSRAKPDIDWKPSKNRSPLRNWLKIAPKTIENRKNRKNRIFTPTRVDQKTQKSVPYRRQGSTRQNRTLGIKIGISSNFCYFLTFYPWSNQIKIIFIVHTKPNVKKNHK